VALYLVSRLRHRGMDANGNLPDEHGYDPDAVSLVRKEAAGDSHHDNGHAQASSENDEGAEMVETGHGGTAVATRPAVAAVHRKAVSHHLAATRAAPSGINWRVLHEVFLNPGLFLLFAGIAIGFVSRLQGEKVTAPN